jgi:hypothetical protein
VEIGFRKYDSDSFEQVSPDPKIRVKLCHSQVALILQDKMGNFLVYFEFDSLIL